MALIPCPECKTEISEMASSCPKCGYPIAEKKETKKKSAPPPPPKGYDPNRERICPGCQAAVSNDFFSCPHCGFSFRPVSVSRPNSPKAAPPVMPEIYLPASYRRPLATCGFLDRVFAYLLDWIIWILIWFTAFSVALAILAVIGHEPVGQTIRDFAKGYFSSIFHSSKDTNILLKLLVNAIWVVYFAFFESSRWQGSPGKMILRLKVMDEAGDRISFWNAVGRNLGKYVSAIILGIGFLMVIFTQKKQALHDFMAGTLVCLADGTDSRRKDDVAPLKYDPG